MVRQYTAQDLDEMIRIWNEVVEEGVAFLRKNIWTERQARNFLHRRLIRL